jgi:hypothetical protein
MSFLDLYEADQRAGDQLALRSGGDLPGYWQIHGHEWLVFGASVSTLLIGFLLLVHYRWVGDRALTAAARGLRLSRQLQAAAANVWAEIERRAER